MTYKLSQRVSALVESPLGDFASIDLAEAEGSAVAAALGLTGVWNRWNKHPGFFETRTGLLDSPEIRFVVRLDPPTDDYVDIVGRWS